MVALFLWEKTMTVANNYHKVTYVGNGSTTSFSFDFPIIGDSSIKVYVSIDDTETEVDASNYSVNVSDNGGNVVFKTAPVKGSVVAIIRLTDQTQETPYKTSSGFPAVRVEEAFDKLTMITQEQQEVLDRCLKVVPTNGQKPQELLDEVYARLDSSIEIAESAQKAANEASSAVVRAEDLLEDTTEYVTTSKAEIGTLKTETINQVESISASAVSEIGTLKTETINEVEGVSASAIASVTSTSLSAVDSINVAKTNAETNIAKIVSNAEGTIEEIAVEAAQKEVENAANQASEIATNNLNVYINNSVKPDLNTYVTSAKNDATTASNSATQAKQSETSASRSAESASNSANECLAIKDNLENVDLSNYVSKGEIDDILSNISSIGYIGDYDSTYTYKAGDIVRRYVDDANGYMFFMSVSDNNKGNSPAVISLFDPKWFCITRTYPYVYSSSNEVPIATINASGSSGGKPSNWTLHVPNTTTRLNQMPKIDLYTGKLKAPSGIEGYDTSEESESKINTVVDSKFQVVSSLPSSPTEGVFYYLVE
jgi:hypothetical protein